jgi:hypothetical protein
VALPPIQLDGAAVLHHLNQVISWYRHSQQASSLSDCRATPFIRTMPKVSGAEVVRLAFQSAKAEAALITFAAESQRCSQASGGDDPAAESGPAAGKDFFPDRSIAIADRKSNRADCETPGVPEEHLISQRDALQGQLELQKALLDAVQKMAAFVETNGEIAGGLDGGINQLARSIPEVLGSSASPQKTVVAPTSSQTLACQLRRSDQRGNDAV